MTDTVSTEVGNDKKFAWGVKEIAKEIERTPRQTHHLLIKGRLASAKKVGGNWVASRDALRRELGA